MSSIFSSGEVKSIQLYVIVSQCLSFGMPVVLSGYSGV